MSESESKYNRTQAHIMSEMLIFLPYVLTDTHSYKVQWSQRGLKL